MQETNGIRWIGMRAYGLDEKIKDFIWWNNFKVGDLNNETNRYHAAAFVARLYMEMNKAEAAIGKAVDLDASNSKRNYIAIPKNQKLCGIYIQADRRLGLNAMANMRGIETEAFFRRRDPVEFDRIFQQARKVLPYV